MTGEKGFFYIHKLRAYELIYNCAINRFEENVPPSQLHPLHSFIFIIVWAERTVWVLSLHFNITKSSLSSNGEKNVCQRLDHCALLVFFFFFIYFACKTHRPYAYVTSFLLHVIHVDHIKVWAHFFFNIIW